MSQSVFVGLWNAEKFHRVKIEDVDLESKVKDLKIHLCKTLEHTSTDTMNLSYCGVILEDCNNLLSYGITSGVTIHLTEKPKVVSPPPRKKITEAEVQEIVSSFRNFKMSSGFRTTLHRLENIDEVDKVIAAVPGLENDPIAISFISKPDLILQMEDPKAVWQIGEKHPHLLEAARFIATDFHCSTTPNAASTSLAATPSSSGYSYSLDALSDDDDDMEGDSSGAAQGAITAAQLAAALAHAASTPPTSARITAEMLQQALPVTPSRFASQLRQMRELGLQEESRNLRALAAAQGDLQAAIDLVFSGALDD
ncbi:ubiquitin-like protein 7 [Cylas formicarius]|uniref:ubiquitin-like protein 7 n=1 Tax=Cylas formicarius TaxID=197179 RepID=UPI002958C8D6|nr:ubiquitin-like protein 7 [Cylas formicarius]